MLKPGCSKTLWRHWFTQDLQLPQCQSQLAQPVIVSPVQIFNRLFQDLVVGSDIAFEIPEVPVLGQVFLRILTMFQIGLPAAFKTLWSPRSGAHPAVHPATAISHGWGVA